LDSLPIPLSSSAITTTHIFPLAAQLKGIKGLTIGKCESMDPQQPPAFYRVTSFYFESRIALEALLTSMEGRAALADLPKFATGGYTIMVDEEKVLIPFTMSKT
jgi:uncharacterized protein (TIGR02118 family)